MTNNNHPITPPPELVKQWIRQYGNSEDPRWQAYEQDIANQAARWGNRSTPQPIPVSERLPGPGDCDAEGRCWLSTTEVEPGWVLDYPERCTNYTHWLPAHALPQPS